MPTNRSKLATNAAISRNVVFGDFQVFAVPATFAQDRAALDARWKELQREPHPHRFAAQGAAAQRVAMQWSVRINEAVGIAELFDVSLDALLGRSVAPKNDEWYAAHALLDAVRQASWQVESIEATVRERLDELAAFPGPKGFTMGFPAACEEACDRLTDAGNALHDALNPPEGKPFKRALRKMMIAQLQEEDSADDPQS